MGDAILPRWQKQMSAQWAEPPGDCGATGSMHENRFGAVLVAGGLWTSATADTVLGHDARRSQVTEKAADWLRDVLWDPQYGGVFWSVGSNGQPIDGYKKTCAQGFAIYALTAYHARLISQCKKPPHSPSWALNSAATLFDLLEEHAHDRIDGGYFEGCTREWRRTNRPSANHMDPVSLKSTSTMLHLLEGFTELLRHYPKLRVALRVREIINIFLNSLWQPRTRSFGTSFNCDWRNLTTQIDSSRDMEIAWLLVRAAGVLRDRRLLQSASALALEIANTALQRDVRTDGSVSVAGLPDARMLDDHRYWSRQAEAMVGFWEAWQISGDARYAQAARRVWRYLERDHLEAYRADPVGAFKEGGLALADLRTIGRWVSPYHHTRACFEMIQRLELVTSQPEVAAESES